MTSSLVILAQGFLGAQPAVLVEEYRFGHFQHAVSIALDPWKDIYVSDAAEHTLSKFRFTGEKIRSIGGKGWGGNQFDTPRGVDASLGIIVYAADSQNHRIVRLDKDLHPTGIFSTRENPAPEFRFGTPLDVAVSRLGNLFVLDGENVRIVSTTGMAVVDNSFGGVESGPGRLRNPLAMSLDELDNLYVLEPGRVVVFDGFGNYRREFGRQHITQAQGIGISRQRCFVVTADKVHVFDLDGTHLQEYSRDSMIFQTDPGEFRDIAVAENFLLILSSSGIIVLRGSP